MDKRIRKPAAAHEPERISLGELIHQHVRFAIETAVLFGAAGGKEWKSTIRDQRRMPEVNEAIVATYLAGGNTRRIRGALQPLLKAAPLSKRARCHASSPH
ncbi:MAG TPA: hypothetical protein VE932_11195 [Patescibacteria group bacterium]|nr:hypothetical protein [Patescibacteria group bacterium]